MSISTEPIRSRGDWKLGLRNNEFFPFSEPFPKKKKL